jgi:HSP20 family protein
LTPKEISMAFDLQKWLPFKFPRGGSQARTQPAGAAAAAAGAAPQSPSAAGALDPLQLLRALDPFSLLPGMFRGPLAGASGGGGWFGDFAPALFDPRIDVVDAGDALRITAELPGLDRQDLELFVEGAFLVLRGEKRVDAKQDEKGCYRLERAFGNFQRVLPLPDGVDLERAEARFADGVLTLVLPKKAGGGSAARKLEIK